MSSWPVPSTLLITIYIPKRKENNQSMDLKSKLVSFLILVGIVGVVFITHTKSYATWEPLHSPSLLPSPSLSPSILPTEEPSSSPTPTPTPLCGEECQTSPTPVPSPTMTLSSETRSSSGGGGCAGVPFPCSSWTPTHSQSTLPSVLPTSLTTHPSPSGSPERVSQVPTGSNTIVLATLIALGVTTIAYFLMNHLEE